MKKYKYQRLSNNEKKQAKNDFYQTEQGFELKKRFNRILIYSIILILFGIYLLIEACIKKDSYAQLAYGIILIIFGIGFLISRYYLIIKKVNYYLTKNTSNFLYTSALFIFYNYKLDILDHLFSLLN